MHCHHFERDWWWRDELVECRRISTIKSPSVLLLLLLLLLWFHIFSAHSNSIRFTGVVSFIFLSRSDLMAFLQSLFLHFPMSGRTRLFFVHVAVVCLFHSLETIGKVINSTTPQCQYRRALYFARIIDVNCTIARKMGITLTISHNLAEIRNKILFFILCVIFHFVPSEQLNVSQSSVQSLPNYSFRWAHTVYRVNILHPNIPESTRQILGEMHNTPTHTHRFMECISTYFLFPLIHFNHCTWHAFSGESLFITKKMFGSWIP